jgi:hypothetical protein
MDMKRMENDTRARVQDDTAEVDRLIRELDQLKHENVIGEEEQMRLLDQVVVTEKDIAVMSGELAGVRQQASIED